MRYDTARLKQTALTTLALVAVLWLIHLAVVLAGLDIGPAGVRPGMSTGLVGVVTAPLVHASWMHLFSNTLPLLVLGTAMFYGFPRAARRALPVIWLVSGLAVWLLARESVHVGASGIAYGMMFFVLVAGIMRRDRASVALVMLVFFLHGSMVLGVLPQAPGVSWEYHLAGAVTGGLCGAWWRFEDPMPEPRIFEYDDMPGEGDHDHELGELWQDDPENDDWRH